MKRPFKKRYPVPIFGADLWVIIADDISKERHKLRHVFDSEPPQPGSYDGLCSNNDRGHVGIFLKRSKLSTDIPAHEIFHATHGILKWIGCKFNPDDDEVGARLNGYLSELVRDAIAVDKKRK